MATNNSDDGNDAGEYDLDAALSIDPTDSPQLQPMTARKYLETASARATEMVENALAGDMDAVRESVQIVRHYVERAITELDRDVAARREIVARLRRTRPN